MQNSQDGRRTKACKQIEKGKPQASLFPQHLLTQPPRRPVEIDLLPVRPYPVSDSGYGHSRPY